MNYGIAARHLLGEGNTPFKRFKTYQDIVDTWYGEGDPPTDQELIDAFAEYEALPNPPQPAEALATIRQMIGGFWQAQREVEPAWSIEDRAKVLNVITAILTIIDFGPDMYFLVEETLDQLVIGDPEYDNRITDIKEAIKTYLRG